MATLKEIEKHVLDDAVELIAAVGLGSPLMHTTALYKMEGHRRETALFLRGLFGRHVILVATRLYARKGTGPIGETASIDSYICHAETEGFLSVADADAFRSEQKAVAEKLERDGITLEELRIFRHSEIAHSLQPIIPFTNKLVSLPVWDLADATFELVRKIESAVSGTQRLNKEFQDWLDRGRAFWPESQELDCDTVAETS